MQTKGWRKLKSWIIWLFKMISVCYVLCVYLLFTYRTSFFLSFDDVQEHTKEKSCNRKQINYLSVSQSLGKYFYPFKKNLECKETIIKCLKMTCCYFAPYMFCVLCAYLLKVHEETLFLTELWLIIENFHSINSFKGYVWVNFLEWKI